MQLPDDTRHAFQVLLDRAIAFNPHMRELRERLLREGGQEVFFQYAEPDAAQLIDEGWVFTHRLRRYPGESNACHKNAASIWQKEQKRFRIATGYGLNDHGIWIQHSWLVDGELTIFETTSATFEIYYGIVYTQAQAKWFAWNVGQLRSEQ